MNYSGWAPRPRAFGNFYRRDILYENAGPTGIRGEPKPRREGERERERGRTSFSGGGETAGVDLPPSWFIAQSAFTANGFVFGADACVPTTRIPTSTCIVPQSRSFSSPSLSHSIFPNTPRLCVLRCFYNRTARNVL